MMLMTTMAMVKAAPTVRAAADARPHVARLNFDDDREEENDDGDGGSGDGELFDVNVLEFIFKEQTCMATFVELKQGNHVTVSDTRSSRGYICKILCLL